MAFLNGEMDLMYQVPEEFANQAMPNNELAPHLAKKGIRVNMVAPGPIWTPLQVAGGQLPGKMGEFGQDTPLGRAGQPAELAPLYVMLAEDGTSFSTGTAVGAHGGKGSP